MQTYSDAAKRGVILKKRTGLRQLLQDVVAGNASYKAILVYDVSRWGRFQDTDASAHYEFLCKSAGVPVHYCAEMFGNDGSLPSLIMKALKRTLMSSGFTHGDGWFDILWRLCGDLEPLVAAFEQATGRQFEVLQVKEKFGGLRVHVNHANDAIRQCIEAAVQESLHTCEVCGQPGKRREGGWINTLCDEHDASAQRAREIG